MCIHIYALLQAQNCSAGCCTSHCEWCMAFCPVRTTPTWCCWWHLFTWCPRAHLKKMFHGTRDISQRVKLIHLIINGLCLKCTFFRIIFCGKIYFVSGIKYPMQFFKKMSVRWKIWYVQLELYSYLRLFPMQLIFSYVMHQLLPTVPRAEPVGRLQSFINVLFGVKQ